MSDTGNSIQLSALKTAIVYDKANTQYGGAEQVLTAVSELFPQAKFFTSLYQPKQALWTAAFTQVNTSFLQPLTKWIKNHRLLMALMPLAFERLDLSEFDLIISVTSDAAKGIITKPDQLHICYLLTPTRYLYSHRQKYLNSRFLLKLPGIKQVFKLILRYLTWWDQAAIARADLIIPISNLVKARVEQYYPQALDQLGPVIYPPIDQSFLHPELFEQAGASEPGSDLPKLPEKYHLIVSRLVEYKQIDLALEAAFATNTNLVIVGQGPEYQPLLCLNCHLKKFFKEQGKTSPEIVFLKHQPQAIVSRLLSQAQAYVMSNLEDYGISALQAAALQTPVILQQDSGAAELLDDSNSIKLKELSLESLSLAFRQVKTTQFDHSGLKKIQNSCTTSHFLDNLEGIILSAYKYILQRQL